MTKRPLMILLLVLAALALAGCGGGDDDDGGEAEPPAATETAGGEGETGDVEGDPEAGEAVFASAGCGGCHTLEAAGATGASAPNLDELAPEYDAIREQVENGGGGMPAFKDQLTEEEIANVSAFVYQSTHD